MFKHRVTLQLNIEPVYLKLTFEFLRHLLFHFFDNWKGLGRKNINSRKNQRVAGDNFKMSPDEVFDYFFAGFGFDMEF